MNLTVEIPDDLASRLNAAGGDLSRRAPHHEGGMAPLPAIGTRYELDGFLKAHQVCVDYTFEDFRRELQDLKRLGL